MARRDKRYDSDSSDAASINVPLSLAGRPLYPGFARPPTATMLRQVPRPFGELPPVAPVPLPVPGSPVSTPGAARARSGRRSILKRTEGLWDLGLLEKR